MSMRCEICGKQPSFGNSISKRGLAKKKGGVGQKITGISRRLFKPNIQKIRVLVNGNRQRKRVCTQCIRGGKVQKG